MNPSPSARDLLTVMLGLLLLLLLCGLLTRFL